MSLCSFGEAEKGAFLMAVLTNLPAHFAVWWKIASFGDLIIISVLIDGSFCPVSSTLIKAGISVQGPLVIYIATGHFKDPR